MVARLVGPRGPINLRPSNMYMGQLQSNQIIVSDVAAAPHHHSCIIYQTPTLYGIQDLGTSRYGTFVNDQRLQPNVPHWLNHGDRIRIGHTTFTYQVVRSERSSAGSPQSSGPGLLILAIIVIGLIAYFSQNASSSAQNQSTPQQTLQTFCSAVQNSNYQTAYDQLSSTAQQRGGTEQQFTAKLQRLFAQHKGLKNCAVSKEQAGNSTATGTITYTFVDNGTMSYLDSLTKVNNVWKIDSSNP